MGAKASDESEPEDSKLRNKMFRLTPEAIRAFDILKAKQGPRSGPRLMAEAVDLLLRKYGEKPVGCPERPASGRHVAPRKGANLT